MTIDDDDVMPSSSLCLSLSLVSRQQQKSVRWVSFFPERTEREKAEARGVHLSLSLFSLFIKREMRTFHENRKRDIIDVVSIDDIRSLHLSLFRFLLLLFGAAPAAAAAANDDDKIRCAAAS